jgi:hypothetical protein
MRTCIILHILHVLACIMCTYCMRSLCPLCVHGGQTQVISRFQIPAHTLYTFACVGRDGDVNGRDGDVNGVEGFDTLSELRTNHIRCLLALARTARRTYVYTRRLNMLKTVLHCKKTWMFALVLMSVCVD